jgi:hypothetical protein
MNRLTVIQTLIDQKKLKNYLEIGVFNGHVFFRVKTGSKIAVDPQFRFDTSRKIGKLFVNPYNLVNRYFEKTSDDFFRDDAPGLFEEKMIQISLVDGMHEYAYALKDVENILNYMTDDAVIVLHDCNPATKEMAISFDEWKAIDYNSKWNGDVWKAILHLRSLRSDVTAFVLDCDFGLGVVVKKKNDHPLPFTKADIDRFTYEDLAANRETWLGLKPANYFYEFFGVKP